MSTSWPLRSYRLGGFDEDFGASKLVLVLVHVDRFEEVEDPLLLVSSPCWPGLLGQDGIPEVGGQIRTRTEGLPSESRRG